MSTKRGAVVNAVKITFDVMVELIQLVGAYDPNPSGHHHHHHHGHHRHHKHDK